MNIYKFSINNVTYNVFIAIFVENQILLNYGILNYHVIMNLIELIVILIGLFLNGFLISILLNSSRFHVNLTRIFIGYVFVMQLGTISRMVLMLYQFQLIDTYGSPLPDLPLLIFSFFRMFFISYSGSLLPSIAIERSFSTKHLRDYEKNPRKSISILILIESFVLTFAVTITASFAICANLTVTISVVTPIYLTTTFSALCVLAYLKNKNERTLSSTISKFEVNNYGLSQRFQLEENVMAFLLIRNLVYVVSFLNFFTAILATSAFVIFESTSIQAQILLAFYELSIALYILISSITFLFTIEHWRNDFFSLIGKYFRLKPIPSKISPMPVPDMAAYFDYYKQNW